MEWQLKPWFQGVLLCNWLTLCKLQFSLLPSSRSQQNLMLLTNLHLLQWLCPCTSPLPIFLLHKASLHINTKIIQCNTPGREAFSPLWPKLSLPSNRHLGNSPPSQALCFKGKDEKLLIEKDSMWSTFIFKALFCWTGKFSWGSAHFHLNIHHKL